MPEGLFSVRTQLLAAVARWAYQSDDRPHLARVLFDGKHMVACDGHRLVVVTCETGLPPFSIDCVDVAAVAAAQREITRSRHAEVSFIAVGDRDATIDFDGRHLTVRTYDAKDYPPWEQLLKGLKAESPEPPAYAFEPRYLAAIDQVLEAVDGSHQRSVTVKAWTANGSDSPGPIGPMLFESLIHDGPHLGQLRFLIMPKRS
jgi:hypothetical protein